MKQVNSDYYFTKKYLSLERFISYFYQLEAARDNSPKTLLFIGVGDGMLPQFLKRNHEIKVTTLDIDAALAPDVVGDIRSLPFADKSFDAVCAFEVLEHVPYDEAAGALAEMARVSKDRVAISVPHRRSGFEAAVKFPFIRSLFRKDFLRIALRFPIRFPGFKISGQHYWEIDGRSTRLKGFKETLCNHFVIRKEFTPVLDFYKRFFYLKIK